MSFENLTTGDNQSTGQSTETTTKTGEQAFLIIGERAFHTPDDVVKKIENADSHISTIEEENARLRAELEAAQQRAESETTANDSAAKILEKLQELQQSTGNTANTNAVSKEDLDALKQQAVQEALAKVNEETNRQVAERNLATCLEEAKAAFGDKVGDAVKATAEELGMSTADVDTMAQNKPEVFRRLFLPKSSTSTTQATLGGVMSGSVTTTQQKPQRPEKSIMLGATTQDLKAMWDYCHPDNHNKG